MARQPGLTGPGWLAGASPADLTGPVPVAGGWWLVAGGWWNVLARPGHGPYDPPMTERYRRAGLPERPTLDGVEDRWARHWQQEGTYTFDRSKNRAEVYSIDTPPPTVSAPCTSDTSTRTPTPTPSPATSGCAAGRCSTRWAGTTTACPPSGGCRTSSACAATRRCRTTRPSPHRHAGRPTAAADQPAQLRGAVPAADRDRRARVRAAVAPAGAVGGLVPDVHDDRRRRAGRAPAGVPAQPGTR